MRPVLSREQMRAFDRHAIETCRVPSLVLMENAGRNAAEAIARGSDPKTRVLVVAGRGNNAGDGFVVARHLLGAGYQVGVALLVPRAELKGDAAVNCDAWAGLRGALHEVEDVGAELAPLLGQADVVVDAIFGTGLTRPVDGAFAEAIALINDCSLRVVSLDVPSGLDVDTGQVLGSAVRAALTVTFGHAKPGLFSSVARVHVGELAVVDIGVPGALAHAVGFDAECSEAFDVRALLARRPRARHKGDSGKVLHFAGSPGSVGAARLCARAALRAGAGLSKVATFEHAARALQAGDVETMTTELVPARLDEQLAALLEWADSVVLGPGLGTSKESVALVEQVLRLARVPVILDADGLNAFAGRPNALAGAHALLLTPHPGEAARLLGTSTERVEQDRFRNARELSERTNAVVLLKGEHSLIAAPGERTVVNTTGNSLLAVGGSGDVLSGVLGALARHLSLRQAALASAWLHGRAAELVRARGAERGILASEIADELPSLMSSV